MLLYLLRHAPAESRDARRWPDDALRPLAVDGMERMRLAARGMDALGLSFDLIFTSSYMRARQTADIVSRRFPDVPLVEHRALIPEMGIDAIRAMLRAAPGPLSSVLLVGHEPDLGELACALLSGETGAWLPLKKGGLVCLELERLDIVPSPTRLCWAVPPRVLRALGQGESVKG